MGKGIVKLGEGNWAVKDGNLLAAKETNGRFKNAEFTVARGTDATYVGKNGLIKTASFYNIMSHSEKTTAQNMAVLSGTLSNSTVSSPSLISQVLRFQPTSVDQPRIEIGSMFFNQTYTVSCFVKKGLGDYFGLGLYNSSFSPNANTWVRFNINTGQHDGTEDSNNISNINIDSIGDGWYRISASITTGSIASQSGIKFTAMSSYSFAQTDSTDNYYYISGLQIELGSNLSPYQYTNGKEGIPRIDFTDNTDGHLLLEPESRNLFDYSEDFEPPKWNKSQSELLYGFQSPTGLNTATKITATGSDPYVYRSVNVTQNQTYTFSVYCKGEGSSVEKTARVLFWYGLGTAAGTTTSHEFNLTSGWERVQFQTTPTGSGTLFFRVDVPANSSEVGDVAYIWGAQVEALPYATSYIPTNGSTVTRDAETCTDAGEAQDFNSEEGVLYAEIAALANDGTFRVISLSDGTTSNSLWLYYSSVSNTIQAFDGSTIIAHSIDVTNFIKAAVVYDSNGTRMWVNGSQVGSNTFVGFSGLNKLNFINENESNYNFKGKVKAIKVYKEALSDTELENLTS
jgi:hypothetical protein